MCATQGTGAIGEVCDDNDNCDSGYCSGYPADICTDGSIGSGCTNNNQCDSGYCDYINDICTDGLVGSGCELNINCASGTCASNVCE